MSHGYCGTSLARNDRSDPERAPDVLGHAGADGRPPRSQSRCRSPVRTRTTTRSIDSWRPPGTCSTRPNPAVYGPVPPGVPPPCVRIMHVYLRRRISEHPEWDADAWGVPINQSDAEIT